MGSKHRNLKRLVDLAQPYRGLLFDAILSMLVLAALNLVGPIPMKILIDSAIPEGNLGLLGAIVIGLLCLNLFRQGVSYLNSYTISYVGSRLVFDMRRKLFQHLQRLSLSFYDSRRSGEIVSRLLSDVNSVQTLITGSALNLLVNVFMFLSILIIVFFIHWKLALVSIAIFPLHILTYFFYNKRVTTSSRRASQKSCEIWGSAQEAIGGAKLVKSFTAEVREGKDFVHETKESFGLNLDLTVLSMQWNRTANILASVGTLVVLWYGGVLVMRKEMQLGTFLAFNSYVGMLYGPVMQLISMVGQVLPALVGVERVFEILDMIPEVQEAPEPIVLADMKGEVEFKNVSFSYSEDEEVLKNINFTARPGQIIALVGPSGSGKSTIANLIARFYDRTSGEITVDGVDIAKLQLATFRNQIGTVLQETILFSGTIEDNIRYGKPDATFAEIEEAAKRANAHEYIRKFPEAYKTEIGSMGGRLSGGQRQRLAIARAILRNPKILILDEATSALDTASEALVQEALWRLMRGRTTFVIAHRLSTIKNADKILALKEGRIVQMGTHDELIAQDGLYRKLYEPELAKQKSVTPMPQAKIA